MRLRANAFWIVVPCSTVACSSWSDSNSTPTARGCPLTVCRGRCSPPFAATAVVIGVRL
jgi:hypothetical protein